jgi:hypothetical protein
MKGHIFCPECCVGLFRSPEDKEYNSLGKKAFYSHSRSHTPECSLRVKKAEEKKFENEELAKKAIDENSQEHGIDDESPGKIVIIFGKITESGIGLCIERFGWGEFAVLPDKYTHLLY